MPRLFPLNPTLKSKGNKGEKLPFRAGVTDEIWTHTHFCNSFWDCLVYRFRHCDLCPLFQSVICVLLHVRYFQQTPRGGLKLVRHFLTTISRQERGLHHLHQTERSALTSAYRMVIGRNYRTRTCSQSVMSRVLYLTLKLNSDRCLSFQAVKIFLQDSRYPTRRWYDLYATIKLHTCLMFPW